MRPNKKVTRFIGRPGGVYPSDLDDPQSREAVKQVLGEFTRLALENGVLTEGVDALVVGEATVEEQVRKPEQWQHIIKR